MTAASVQTQAVVDPRSLEVRLAAYELVDQLISHAREEGRNQSWLREPVDLLESAQAVLAAEIQPALAAAWTEAATLPPPGPVDGLLGRMRHGLWRLAVDAESGWLPRHLPPIAGAPPRLLFLDYFVHNVDVLLPVWRHFDAVGPGQRLYVAGRRSAARALRRRRVPALHGARLPPALRVAEPALSAWHRFVHSFARERWPDGWL